MRLHRPTVALSPYDGIETVVSPDARSGCGGCGRAGGAERGLDLRPVVVGMPDRYLGEPLHPAASLASAGRQAGTTLGVAISGTIAGPALARGGTAFTSAAHPVWWL